jgi:hypothetical protein
MDGGILSGSHFLLWSFCISYLYYNYRVWLLQVEKILFLKHRKTRVWLTNVRISGWYLLWHFITKVTSCC